MKLQVICALSALVMTGCATTSPSFEKVADEKNGVVYLYTQCNPESDTWENGAIPTGPTVVLNNKELGVLTLNTYAPLYLREGSNNVKVAENWNYNMIADVELDIESGKTRYIEFDLGFISGNAIVGGTIRSRLAMKPEDVALQKISHCQLQIEILEKQVRLPNSSSYTQQDKGGQQRSQVLNL